LLVASFRIAHVKGGRWCVWAGWGIMGLACGAERGKQMIADRYVVKVEGLVLREERYLLAKRARRARGW